MDKFGEICESIKDLKVKLKDRQRPKKMLRGQIAAIFLFFFLDKKLEISIEFFLSTLKNSHKYMQQKQMFCDCLSAIHFLHLKSNFGVYS